MKVILGTRAYIVLQKTSPFHVLNWGRLKFRWNTQLYDPFNYD